MLENKILIIDFDSTFIKVETLDELAKLILKNDPEKESKIHKITEITNSAMVGEIDFQTALVKRLDILSLTKQDIIEVTNIISTLISHSFKRNKEFIKSISQNIWIVSGGFKDVIDPIVMDYGIKSNRVLANTFLYKNQSVIGCDENNDLFKDKGKIIAIEKQYISGKKFMVGDGYTDYEVFKSGTADHFICFTENLLREKVSQLAIHHANTFEELIKIIEDL